MVVWSFDCDNLWNASNEDGCCSDKTRSFPPVQLDVAYVIRLLTSTARVFRLRGGPFRAQALGSSAAEEAGGMARIESYCLAL